MCERHTHTRTVCLSVSYTGKNSVYASTLFMKKERTVCVSVCVIVLCVGGMIYLRGRCGVCLLY